MTLRLAALAVLAVLAAPVADAQFADAQFAHASSASAAAFPLPDPSWDSRFNLPGLTTLVAKNAHLSPQGVLYAAGTTPLLASWDGSEAGWKNATGAGLVVSGTGRPYDIGTHLSFYPDGRPQYMAVRVTGTLSTPVEYRLLRWTGTRWEQTNNLGPDFYSFKGAPDGSRIVVCT